MQVFAPIATLTDAELAETISRGEEDDEKQFLRVGRMPCTRVYVYACQHLQTPAVQGCVSSSELSSLHASDE